MSPKFIFLFGCVPVRFFLAFLVLMLESKKLRLLSPLFAIIGLSFIFLKLTNKRLTSFESGGKTWWNNVRPVHGLLYILASFFAFKGKNKECFFVLLIDVLFGLSVFFYHYQNKNKY